MIMARKQFLFLFRLVADGSNFSRSVAVSGSAISLAFILLIGPHFRYSERARTTMDIERRRASLELGLLRPDISQALSFRDHAAIGPYLHPPRTEIIRIRLAAFDPRRLEWEGKTVELRPSCRRSNPRRSYQIVSRFSVFLVSTLSRCSFS